MQARVIDPLGSRIRWIAPYAIPAAAFAAGVATGTGWFAFLGVSLAASIGWLLRPRRAYSAELSLSPGAVRIGGPRGRAIRARDVVGASTARTPRGVGLALTLRARPGVPLILELGGEDDAARVREVLGVGHHGFGELRFPLGSGPARTASKIARLSITSFFALLAVGGALAETIGPFLGLTALVAFVIWIASTLNATWPHLLMGAQGIVAKTERGQLLIPFWPLREVTDDGESLHFRFDGFPTIDLRAPRASGELLALSAEQRAHLLAQVHAAIERTQGRGPLKADSAVRLGALRREGTPPRAWLERVDATIEALRGAGGYRASALEREDLWAVLEDPDADADLRAGAARVLLGVASDSRIRIEATLAAVRDDATARRIRVAQLPLDEACRELEELDGDTPSAVSPIPTPGASEREPSPRRGPLR